MGQPRTPEEKQWLKDLGKLLAAARKRGERSQAYVARELGCGQSVISKYEKGLAEPDIRTFQNMAGILNSSLESLLPEDKTKPSFYCTRHKRMHEPAYRKYRECWKYRKI